MTQHGAGVQQWDPGAYARTAAFVARFGTPLLALLMPRPGERILDLGCGDGTLTAELAACGAQVVGIDASPAMVAAASRRGIDARLGDGMRLFFDCEFDAVLSNAALHWMGDLAAVFAGVHRALRPGGCFVGELGGEGNVAMVIAAIADACIADGIDANALNPWTFPTADHLRCLLEGAGFQVDLLQRIERPTALPGDVSDWLTTFAGVFLGAVAADRRDALIADIRERLRPAACRPDGTWWLDYVRLRFKAIRAA